MSVSVLGTLVVDGDPISPRERAVLAALVLRGGAAVPADELADAIWREDPPPTWPKQVQIAIARLRRHPGVPPIVTTPDGYLLDVSPDTVDAVRFERLVGAGGAHAMDDEPDRADAAYSRGLELWRGRAYADLADWPPAIIEAERLLDLRSSAEEERLRARLELGHRASVVSDAERLVQESPLRERRWHILALALYRGGRQADALAAIREARRRLDDELGIELSDELADLETAILRHEPMLDGPLAAPAPATTCPYRGLDAFDVGDEEDFFGRSHDIIAALARVDRSRFVAFAGPSGCGKSSLVRAGITPALRRQGRKVEILLPRRAIVSAVRDQIAVLRPGDVLIVDQFEELLHLGLTDEAVDETCAALAGFADRGGVALVTVRSDFLDECALLPHLGPSFTDGVHLVPPIGADGLREAIEGPARRAGLRLQPGLTELILRDAAGHAGALPLVSHSLVETWLRREGATLTVDGYEASGGLSGAIAQSADRLYQRMSPAERSLCRSTMLRLISLGADGSPVRRTLPIKSLHDDADRDRVLAMLAAARLVSADETTVVVSHEALADAWPRLRGWLEDDADDQRTMHALTNAAETWDGDGRPDEDLYRGGRLETALEWRAAGDRDLTTAEAAFLTASESREASERRALAEREQHERRQNRRLRTLLIAASGLIVLLVGAGTFAGLSAAEAERQRASASVEALVSTALSLRASERDVAALLAAEAYRQWPGDARTRSGMLGVLAAADGYLGNVFVDDADRIFGAVIPGTERVFVVDDTGAGSIRDLETAAPIRSVDVGFEDPEITPPFPLVEVSSDGRIGVVLWPIEIDPDGPAFYGISISSDLVVVDLTSGERLLGPLRLEVGAGALAVQDDGARVAVASARTGAVWIVEVPTGAVTPVKDQKIVPLELDSVAAALAFTADRRLLAGRLGDAIEVIDPVAATVTARFAVPEASANVSMEVLGSGLVVASGDRAIIAVGPGDGRLRWTHRLTAQLSMSCTWITASELVDRVYCGGQSGRVMEYDLDDGKPVGSASDALIGTIGPLAVTGDGAELVSLSQWHSTFSRWKLDGSGIVNRLIAPGSFLIGGYAQDGHALLTAEPRADALPGEAYEGVAIRDPATGRVIDRFSAPVSQPAWAGSDAVVGWFPDDEALRIVDARSGVDVGPPLPGRPFRSWTTHAGTRLYVMTEDGWIIRIDPATGQQVGEPIVVPAGWAAWLSASPDGRRLAISSFDDERRNHLTLVDADSGDVIRSDLLQTGTQVLLDDGSLIGTDDNRMIRYDTSTYRQTGALPGTAGGLGIPSTSDDGRLMLMSARDGVVMLYDLEAGIRLAEPFRTASPEFVGGHLRPDGLEFAISDAAGVMVWDLDPDHHLEALCRIAGRDLTEDEWRSHLSSVGEPRSTCDLG